MLSCLKSKPRYKKYMVKIPKDVLVIYSDFNGHILFKKDKKMPNTKCTLQRGIHETKL